MGVDGPTPFQSKGLRRGEWERNGKGGGVGRQKGEGLRRGGRGGRERGRRSVNWR